MRWISIADEEQPKVTPQNPYPTHWVRLQCAKHVPSWTMIRAGELRLFGRDSNRPNWVDAVDGKLTPLENDSWVVTHYLSDSLDKIKGWPKDDN